MYDNVADNIMKNISDIGISENIKHNADNAQTAGSISIESAEEVNNGSQQMNEMIGAMEDIKNA